MLISNKKSQKFASASSAFGQDIESDELTNRITVGSAEDLPVPPTGDSVPTVAEVYVEDGARMPEKEYGINSTVTVFPSIGTSDTSIGDIAVNSNVYSDVFFVATGIGSESAISRTTVNLGATITGGSAGPVVSIGSGASVILDDIEITVDGSQRYAAYVIEDGKLVVKNSTLKSTGAADGDGGEEPASNSALLIYGMSRTNMSVGSSQTYYLNSSVIAEGWAALSTDSATGSGLNLYTYNTYAEATNGGYGIYADTNCRGYLYGSVIQSAEIGAIIAKNGAIEVLDGSAVDVTTASYLAEGDATTGDGSIITGGRNAVMLHSPDMMGGGLSATDTGILTARKSVFATDEVLMEHAVTDYAEKYGEEIGAYIKHIKGSAILVKSTSTYITLEGTVLKSYSGVLIHTVLNNDSMGNFLAEGDADNAAVDNVNVIMSNVTETGDILHEDYQRYMYLTLDNADLVGAVVSGTYEDWVALWDDYSNVNWMPDDSWSTVNGVHMTLVNNSTWTVRGTSTLSSLTIEEGSGIVAPSGMLLTMTVNDRKTKIVSGTHTGEIILVAHQGLF